ncbi:uncharacterized protein TNCV_4156981 [Trichonephila clavipes]|nr:uncharacterized protein TNCV_4156981 [Trichonephila clavipes]
MDKFLSRKRTFDDNKASTSAQTSIVPKIKSRKYSQEYLNFGFTITEVNGEEKPLCVICSKILAADSMKPNKLKRHFETLHEQQLFGKLRDKLFSIQLDEATDSNKDAHFIAYVRFWDVTIVERTKKHAGILNPLFNWVIKKDKTNSHITKTQQGVKAFFFSSSDLGGCGSPVVKASNHGRHVMRSIPVPLKTRRVGQRCTLNLSRAETSSRWCGVVVRRRGVPAQVSSTSLDHGSKLRGPSPKALV